MRNAKKFAAIVITVSRARLPAAMEGLPKVHSDTHLGEGVSATPSVVPSRTDDDEFAADADPALGALAGKLHRFAVRNHRFLSLIHISEPTRPY